MLKSALGLVIWIAASVMLIIPAASQSRLALIIGNSAYESSPLINPVNDASLMATTLEKSGFKVTKILNANQKSMKRALIEFGRELRKTGAVGLFYYAGHGVQVKGENYLIPIDTNIQDETEVEVEAINVNGFLGTMERSSSAINIVILDACRNNPFARSFRSAIRGLARVAAPRGSYIAYATAPGQVAFDGTTGNSPYTLALTKAIAEPGLNIEQVFKQARREVLSATRDKQVPWENSSITGNFYFSKDTKTQAPKLVTVSPSRPGNSAAIELAYWNSISTSNSEALYRSYLQQYPKGAFSPIAEDRIRSLHGTKQASLTPQTPPAPPASQALEENTEEIEPSETERTLNLQGELTRVGCKPGKIDGQWGNQGRKALNRFKRYARLKLPYDDLSQEIFEAVQDAPEGLCPAPSPASVKKKTRTQRARASRPAPAVRRKKQPSKRSWNECVLATIDANSSDRATDC